MFRDDDDEDEVLMGVTRYGVMPSLMALQQMRNRHQLAMLGKKLMKWTMMAAGKELRRLALELCRSYATYGEDVRTAYIKLARARFFVPFLNDIVRENHPHKSRLTIASTTKVVSGFKLIRYMVLDSNEDPYPFLGISQGGNSVQDAKDFWLKLVKRIIEVIEIRTSFEHVAMTHLSATKKYHGMTKLLIPKITVTLNYIVSELEEDERQETFRLKRFKQLKTETIRRETRECRHCHRILPKSGTVKHLCIKCAELFKHLLLGEIGEKALIESVLDNFDKLESRTPAAGNSRLDLADESLDSFEENKTQIVKSCVCQIEIIEMIDKDDEKYKDIDQVQLQIAEPFIRASRRCLISGPTFSMQHLNLKRLSEVKDNENLDGTKDTECYCPPNKINLVPKSMASSRVSIFGSRANFFSSRANFFSSRANLAQKEDACICHPICNCVNEAMAFKKARRLSLFPQNERTTMADLAEPKCSCPLSRPKNATFANTPVSMSVRNSKENVLEISDSKTSDCKCPSKIVDGEVISDQCICDPDPDIGSKFENDPIQNLHTSSTVILKKESKLKVKYSDVVPLNTLDKQNLDDDIESKEDLTNTTAMECYPSKSTPKKKIRESKYPAPLFIPKPSFLSSKRCPLEGAFKPESILTCNGNETAIKPEPVFTCKSNRAAFKSEPIFTCKGNEADYQSEPSFSCEDNEAEYQSEAPCTCEGNEVAATTTNIENISKTRTECQSEAPCVCEGNEAAATSTNIGNFLKSVEHHSILEKKYKEVIKVTRKRNPDGTISEQRKIITIEIQIKTLAPECGGLCTANTEFTEEKTLSNLESDSKGSESTDEYLSIDEGSENVEENVEPETSSEPEEYSTPEANNEFDNVPEEQPKTFCDAAVGSDIIVSEESKVEGGDVKPSAIATICCDACKQSIVNDSTSPDLINNPYHVTSVATPTLQSDACTDTDGLKKYVEQHSCKKGVSITTSTTTLTTTIVKIPLTKLSSEVGNAETCPSNICGSEVSKAKTYDSKSCSSEVCKAKTSPIKSFSSEVCKAKTPPPKSFSSEVCKAKTPPPRSFSSEVCNAKGCPSKNLQNITSRTEKPKTSAVLDLQPVILSIEQQKSLEQIVGFDIAAYIKDTLQALMPREQSIAKPICKKCSIERINTCLKKPHMKEAPYKPVPSRPCPGKYSTEQSCIDTVYPPKAYICKNKTETYHQKPSNGPQQKKTNNVCSIKIITKTKTHVVNTTTDAVGKKPKETVEAVVEEMNKIIDVEKEPSFSYNKCPYQIKCEKREVRKHQNTTSNDTYSDVIYQESPPLNKPTDTAIPAQPPIEAAFAPSALPRFQVQNPCSQSRWCSPESLYDAIKKSYVPTTQSFYTDSSTCCSQSDSYIRSTDSSLILEESGKSDTKYSIESDVLLVSELSKSKQYTNESPLPIPVNETIDSPLEPKEEKVNSDSRNVKETPKDHPEIQNKEEECRISQDTSCCTYYEHSIAVGSNYASTSASSSRNSSGFYVHRANNNSDTAHKPDPISESVIYKIDPSSSVKETTSIKPNSSRSNEESKDDHCKKCCENPTNVHLCLIPGKGDKYANEILAPGDDLQTLPLVEKVTVKARISASCPCCLENHDAECPKSLKVSIGTNTKAKNRYDTRSMFDFACLKKPSKPLMSSKSYPLIYTNGHHYSVGSTPFKNDFN